MNTPQATFCLPPRSSISNATAALLCIVILSIASIASGQVFTQSWSYSPVTGAHTNPGITQICSDGQGGLATIIYPEANVYTTNFILWLDSNGAEIWRSPPSDWYAIDAFRPGDILAHRFVPYIETVWIRAQLTETGVIYGTESTPSDTLGVIPQNLTSHDRQGFFRVEGRNIVRYRFAQQPPAIKLAQSEFGSSSGNISLRWWSMAGTSYQVQKASNATNWLDVGSELTGVGGYMTYTEATSPLSNGFYRVIER